MLERRYPLTLLPRNRALGRKDRRKAGAQPESYANTLQMSAGWPGGLAAIGVCGGRGKKGRKNTKDAPLRVSTTLEERQAESQ